jgi:hypothetical protein
MLRRGRKYIYIYDVRKIKMVGDRTCGYLYMVPGVWSNNNFRYLCRKNLLLEQVLIPRVERACGQNQALEL